MNPDELNPNDIFLVASIFVALLCVVFARFVLGDMVATDTPVREHKIMLIKVGCYISAITLVVIAIIASQMK
jgi:hypothetical protein